MKLRNVTIRASAALVGLLLFAAYGQAQAKCPWFNVATASGMLDGPAMLEVTKPSADETHCLFRYANGSSVYTLEIVVRAHQDVSKGLAPELGACTSPTTPLRAIGNEAALCTEDRRSSRGDVVVGRVRDSFFRVSISTSLRNDPAMTRDILEQKVTNTAEQIAGALF